MEKEREGVVGYAWIPLSQPERGHELGMGVEDGVPDDTGERGRGFKHSRCSFALSCSRENKKKKKARREARKPLQSRRPSSLEAGSRGGDQSSGAKARHRNDRSRVPTQKARPQHKQIGQQQRSNKMRTATHDLTQQGSPTHPNPKTRCQNGRNTVTHLSDEPTLLRLHLRRRPPLCSVRGAEPPSRPSTAPPPTPRPASSPPAAGRRRCQCCRRCQRRRRHHCHLLPLLLPLLVPLTAR